MTDICIHCVVSGRVQGVFYRRAALEQANLRDLKGWAKNLPDGRVELLICGEVTAVRDLEKWLWIGPEAATVALVETSDAPWQALTTFEVK